MLQEMRPELLFKAGTSCRVFGFFRSMGIGDRQGERRTRFENEQSVHVSWWWTIDVHRAVEAVVSPFSVYTLFHRVVSISVGLSV